MSLPLDSDGGFLQRECPTCERELKWLPSPDPEADEAVVTETDGAEAPESCYCPYCAVTAPPDAWQTKAQIAVMEETARRELVDPELDKLERSIKRLKSSSGRTPGKSPMLWRNWISWTKRR
jgi:hypothetical protein